MNKQEKTIYLCILALIIFMNLVFNNENIIEANTNKEDKEDKKSKEDKEDNDLCLKAALLAQKNNHMLEKIKNEYEELFDKKMKTLQNKCANAGKAIYMSKEPDKHMKK